MQIYLYLRSNKILLNEMKRARLKQMKEARDKYVTCVHFNINNY